MISAIVAVNNDWGIGYNGDLLEHIPEDLKYFKKLTENNVVIMGRKTWDSLPKKPLPNRLNMIVTSQIKSSAGCALINGEYMALSLDNVILQLHFKLVYFIDFFKKRMLFF